MGVADEYRPRQIIDWVYQQDRQQGMPMKRCQETFKVRVRGPIALFTRPELRVERVSYEVMTPSAARGVLEAIHWKPAIRWVVTAIHVLAPVQFISFKRNEVAGRASERRGPVIVEDDRQQRNSVALRDVDYVIEAHFHLTRRAGADDTVSKHVDIFARRLQKGQTFHQPYLGCREFAAMVDPVDAVPESQLLPEWRDRDLGLMLHDLEFPNGVPGGQIVPRFFRAKLQGAKMDVPPFEMATRGEPLAGEVPS
jgi:CRISPR-associated protein Cas5d